MPLPFFTKKVFQAVLLKLQSVLLFFLNYLFPAETSSMVLTIDTQTNLIQENVL